MTQVTTTDRTITDRVLVVPVAMVRPNRRCVYAPSRVGRSFYTDRRNVEAIADYGRTILVSFDEDGVSRPRLTTAYGFGFYCWFILQEDCHETTQLVP